MADIFSRMTSFFLLCLLLTAAGAQDETEACTDVQQKLQGLTTAVEVLCGTSTATPPVQSSPFVNWTSVPITGIGGTNLRTPSTFSYTIPNVIPSTAKEVLVYALLSSGYATRGVAQHLKIFTQEGSNRYEKYLYVLSYNQEAHNTNSDNMWFPMPTNRRIMMTVSRDGGNNCNAQLYAIGYR